MSSTTGVARIGLLARDPLRIAGIEVILGNPERYVVSVLETPTAAQLAALDLVLLDGAGTDQYFALDHVFALMTALQHLRPTIRLLVLGESAEPAMMERVIDAGARGYLLHTASAAELQGAVDVVCDGSIWAPRKVLANLLERARQGAGTVNTQAVPFSGRELEVLGLLVQGRSNREIGEALGIREGTVKAHLARLMARTATGNRTALTMLALERGWV